MLFVRPLSVFLITFLVLMCWILDLISAATLARTRAQNKTSNKTHPLSQSVRPSEPTPKLFFLQTKDNLSSNDQQVSVSTQNPSVRSMDSILLHKLLHQQYQHGKSSIVGNPSQLTMSTEAPSTTTMIYDHHATTERNYRKKRSILDPPNLSSRYLDQDEFNNDDLESEWSLDNEEEKVEADSSEDDESIDYDELDFNQPNHQLVVDESVDFSVGLTNGVNQNDFPSSFEENEDDAEDDIILVVGPLTTSKPITNSYEKKNVSKEYASQLFVEKPSPNQIGLNEWPVQVGLQARTKQYNTVTKLVDSQMGNGNGQQTIPETQKFNGQQSGNKSEDSSNFHGNSERLNDKNDENDADSYEDLSTSYIVHSQFMNSPTSTKNSINKTKQQETSIEPLEIVDRMMNHYGNPRQNNPIISSTLPVPDILRDAWYANSEEEKDQKPTTTAEPEEAFYYISSEKETDMDLYLDYPEEKEDDAKPSTLNVGIVNNSATITRRPSTNNLGRPPYFVSSTQIEQFQPIMDVSDEIGMILNPIGVIDRRMDTNVNSRINFVENPDLVEPSPFFIPIPSDTILSSRPSLNLNPHQQQEQPPTVLPVAGRIDNFQKDKFVANSEYVQLPNIKTELISDSPRPSKASEPFAYVTQEVITQNPIEINNGKNIYVNSNTSLTTGLVSLPYSVMSSSSTMTSMPFQSMKSNGVLGIPMDDDAVVTFTPSPTRPFIQSPYVTWATTKAKSGPYFITSAATDQQQSGIYYTGKGMRKQLNETVQNPTGITNNRDIAGRTKSTSASRGRPPYFVTPTPLFQPNHLNEFTGKPTDIIKTPTNSQNITNNQQTTIRLGSEGVKENFKTENNFVTSGPTIKPSPQPTYINVARSNNIARPIELVVSTSESDKIDQKLDINIKESIPNPIGIRNKNNVYVVPKSTDFGSVQMPNASFPAGIIKATSEQSSIDMSNHQHTNKVKIVNHGMGSFVITSSPAQSSTRQIVTHPSASTEASTTTTVATVESPSVINPKKSESTSFRFEQNHTMQEVMTKPMGIVQNPIGISNKNNVFVVPKSNRGIARPPILSNTFPADFLMKRHGLSNDNEEPILRPFERIVKHQMGSFVVTTKPDDVHIDTTTAAPIEQSFFNGSVESVQKIDILIPETEEKTKTGVRIVQNSTEIENTKSVDRSEVSASNGLGRPPYFAKSSTAAPFQPIYLNQHSMSKLVEEIAKFQRGNLKGNVDSLEDVAQPSLSSFRKGQFMKSISNKNNNQQQQMSRMNLRRPVGTTESQSNPLNVITLKPNIHRQRVNLPSNNRTPKNPAAKSSKRKT